MLSVRGPSNLLVGLVLKATQTKRVTLGSLGTSMSELPSWPAIFDHGAHFVTAEILATEVRQFLP